MVSLPGQLLRISRAAPIGEQRSALALAARMEDEVGEEGAAPNTRVADDVRADAQEEHDDEQTKSEDEDSVATRDANDEEGPRATDPACSDSESGEFCTTPWAIDLHDNIRLPASFFSLRDLCSVLSLETWNEVLSSKERQYLRQYLPQGLDENEGGFLSRLLSGDDSINFGNPAKRLMGDILSGKCHPSVVKFRGILNDLEYNTFFHRLRDHHNGMVERLVELEKENKASREEGVAEGDGGGGGGGGGEVKQEPEPNGMKRPEPGSPANGGGGGGASAQGSPGVLPPKKRRLLEA